jgi:uncharacterized membrane protein
VPLSNYFGWLFTSWLFFQAFALYLRRRQADPPQSARTERKLRLIAILFCETAVAVMVFTMFFSALLAALRLAGERSSE